MARREFHTTADDLLARCGGWPGFLEILAEMQLTHEATQPTPNPDP